MQLPANLERLVKVRVPLHLVLRFSQQLAFLLSSVVPLTLSLETLSHQPECPAFGEIVGVIGLMLESGYKFSYSLALFPKVFPELFVVMAEIGESNGRIHKSFEKLSVWLERDERLLRKVRSAATYPAVVLVVAALLTVIMFSCVLPGFLHLFSDLNVPLPLITRIILGLTRMVISPLCWVLFAGLAAYALTEFRRWSARPEAARRIFEFFIGLPLVGPVLSHSTISRYASILSVLLDTGVDLVRSLGLAARASGSPLILRDHRAVTDLVKSGKMLSHCYKRRPDLYSNVLVNFTRVGEESSKWPQLLEQAGSLHYAELELRLDAASAAMEPLLLTGVALLVGTVVIAMFLPLYGFLSKMS